MSTEIKASLDDKSVARFFGRCQVSKLEGTTCLYTAITDEFMEV